MIASLPRRRALAAAVAIGFGPAAAGPAHAHSELHHTEPADGAVLRGSPPAIALLFAAPVRVMTLRLLDERGREQRLVREGAPGAAATEIRATVQEALPPGAYRVEWRGASPDGHVGGGTLSFRVERAGR
ncbi:copper resistance protein CopC [Roseomonas hellenica]|uniref:Copper resistance protein CopC n=1 Tax=Plastoroseomonas hellenica TaxID=2687306 RepID=A0ABS5F393_9PROT|nr:copper resistance CopC family protein [Plastoroseomonas hellenica]MBR0667056.1 copper resistance protein CopC [Plastoroseomonas hellenica]